MTPHQQRQNQQSHPEEDENTSLLPFFDTTTADDHRSYDVSSSRNRTIGNHHCATCHSQNTLPRYLSSSSSSSSSMKATLTFKPSLKFCGFAAVVLVGCSLMIGLVFSHFWHPSMNGMNKDIVVNVHPNIGPPSSLQNAYYGIDDDKISDDQQQQQHTATPEPKPPSKYTDTQYFGFQIYTGGAPALIPNNKNVNSTTTTTNGKPQPKYVPNEECIGLNSYGEVVLETDPVLLCYLGHADPMEDVQHRLQIMRDAVEVALTQADPRPTTMKIFVAPEFYWRGREQGSYLFRSSDRVFSDACEGPICAILRGLEDIVEDARMEDWFFLFGTIVASQHVHKPDDPNVRDYQHLFYNFAPIYKGFDPTKVDNTLPLGKRFLLPKRYISASDFLQRPNIQKDADVKQGWDEVLGQENNEAYSNPLYQPRYRYDDRIFDEYKLALTDDAGYVIIEYDWLIVDGITMTLEICFDHEKKTALNTYLGDMIQGRRARIPKSNSAEDDPTRAVEPLEYVPIPIHQAQLGLVSSAGMTANAQAFAVVDHGTLYLQDGLNNEAAKQYIDHDLWMTCDQAVQFKGGTEAISRKSIVSITDVNFLYEVHEPMQKLPVYNSSEWKDKLYKSFTTAHYSPHVMIYPPIPLQFPTYPLP